MKKVVINNIEYEIVREDNGCIDKEDLAEKITDYFDNRRLLTVGSSGDQLLNAFYNGARDITLFDINEYAKYGFRYWTNKLAGQGFILDLYTVCLPLEMETTEEYKYKVAEKFVEIAERTTERDNTGMRDALKVLGIMEDYTQIDKYKEP